MNFSIFFYICFLLKTLTYIFELFIIFKPIQSYLLLKSRVLRISILAVLLFFTSQLQALILTGENPWSVGINFSPNFCYRTIRSNSKDPFMESWINSLNNYEVNGSGFNTGIQVSYKIRNAIAVESGLSYANYSYQNRPFPVATVNYPDFRSTTARYFYHFTYFEIPLRIVYIGNAPKNSFTFSAGIINQFGLDQYTFERIESGNKIVEDNKFYGDKINSYNIASTISFGYLFRKSKKVSYHIEPTFRHQLLNYNEGSDLKKYLISLGFQFGVYYRL